MIITAGTPSAASDQVNNVVGLALNHAYSVIDTFTVLNADGTTKAKLFKMRNPWGSDGAYFGAWCDADTIWSTVGQTYATQVGFVSANDGIFFITVEDFVKYYDAFVVSNYRDGWTFSTSSVIGDNGIWKRFDFTLASAQEGFIGVDFYTNRMYPKGCRATQTTGSLRVFAKGQLIDSVTVYDINDYGFINNKNFPAGSYQVYFKPTW